MNKLLDYVIHDFTKGQGEIPVEKIIEIVDAYLDSKPESMKKLIEELVQPIPQSEITKILN